MKTLENMFEIETYELKQILAYYELNNLLFDQLNKYQPKYIVNNEIDYASLVEDLKIWKL